MDEEVITKKKVNIKAVIAIVVCIAVILSVVGYDLIKNNTEYEDTAIAMGTVINLKLYGSDGEQTSSDIESKINDIETSLLSWRKEGSDIYRINSANGSSVAVSPETSEIISQALEISSQCGGVFDITIGKITQMWDFGGDNQRVPSSDEINHELSSVDYHGVTVSGTSVTIANNQSIDLGAVGKGATCDILKTMLETSKTKSAVISIGGSLLLYGNKNFTIGITNPTDDTTYMGTLKLSDICVSTSGNYEKTFEENGVTYHHILDARSGYPAKSNLTSVTVVCKSGVVSDALSTACYILGYDDSLELLKKYNAQAVFIFSDKSVKYTDGLEDVFSITDDNFKVNK